MSISYDESRRLFKIDTPRMSYAFCIAAGVPISLYWGAPLHDPAALESEINALQFSTNGAMARPPRPECSTNDGVDYGEASILPIFADGVRGMRPVYQSHSIDGDTLRVVLKDKYYDFTAVLCYRAIGKLDLIERWIEVTNHTGAPVELPIFRCGNVQLPSRDNYRLTHYSGNWGAEYQPQRHMLHQEQVVLESHRGTCSSHQHTPFVTLDPDGEATDTQGDVFFAALEWSGENKMIVEKN